MRYSSVTGQIEKITSIESNYEQILKQYSETNNKKIVASPCYFIPPEIFAAFDIVTLKIPEFILNTGGISGSLASLFSAVVVPEKNCFCSEAVRSDKKPYVFRTPSGYGEDASVSLHNEISLMLKTLFSIEIRSIDIEKLRRETSVHEKLRRMVRSICSLRTGNIKMLNNRELALIFETAVILPPEIATGYLAPLFEEMGRIEEKNEKRYISGMIYGGKTVPAVIADAIEDSGILVVEDDSCSGRRLFDMSLNTESEYLFYEMLDAYSYRPLTPCLRAVNERYELLYRLLRTYHIETVIFYNDEKCGDSAAGIDYLRIKLMRDGIDPLVIDEKNYREIISDYIKRY